MKLGFQVFMDFTLANTAYPNIIIPHRDILQVIQVTEYAYLSKLGHSRQHSELDTAVHGFQGSIKGFQCVAECLL